MRRQLWWVAALVLCAGVVQAEESAWTLFEKGVKEFQKKQHDRAAEFFEAALRHDSRCQDAYYYLGVIQEKRGKLREAVELWSKIEDNYPTYSLAAERLGHVALRQGKLDVAEKYFKIHADARPSTNSLLQLAAVQLDQKKYTEAEVTLNKAGEFTKGDLDLAEAKGRLYMETQRYKEALEEYTGIVKAIPRDTTARHLRGLCLAKLDRGDEASAEWEEVLKVDPWHQQALLSLAEAYTGDPDHADQLKEYRRRLKILEKAKPKVRQVSGGPDDR